MLYYLFHTRSCACANCGGGAGGAAGCGTYFTYPCAWAILAEVLLKLLGATLFTIFVGVMCYLLEEVFFDDHGVGVMLMYIVMLILVREGMGNRVGMEWRCEHA